MKYKSIFFLNFFFFSLGLTAQDTQRWNQRFGGQHYSANLFHEFAHEWWANKVTNKDWAHMWIQEGIATFSEALCFRELTGEKGYDSLLIHFKNRIENDLDLRPKFVQS